MQSSPQKRIKNLLMKYKVLCNEQILAKLEKHGFNDSCIYICQILKNVKKSIKITINEVGHFLCIACDYTYKITSSVFQLLQ